MCLKEQCICNEFTNQFILSYLKAIIYILIQTFHNEMSFLIRTEFFHSPYTDTLHSSKSVEDILKTYNFPGLIRCALINISIFEYMIQEFRETDFNNGPDS